MSGYRLLSTISSQTVTLSMMTGCQANHLRHWLLSFGFIFISIHPFVLVPRCLEVSRPDYELDFSRSELLMSGRLHVPPTASQCMCVSTGGVGILCAPVHVTPGILALCLSARHGRIVAKALQSGRPLSDVASPRDAPR